MDDECRNKTQYVSHNNAHITWYNEDDEEEEDIIRVPNVKNKSKIVNAPKEHSNLDYNLKKFIYHCDMINTVINDMLKERDSVRTNDKYFKFRQELNDIKNDAIIEAYTRKCFNWDFD